MKVSRKGILTAIVLVTLMVTLLFYGFPLIAGYSDHVNRSFDRGVCAWIDGGC